jgi:sarcosine oxidase subunit beta
MKTDVVIIGGGIVGCATAYYLSCKGRRVVVIEKDAGAGLQASGRNAGGVRQQGRRAALPLAMEAIRLWGGLAQELASELEYHRTGNLILALDEKSSANLEEEAVWEQAQGLLDVRMISAAECHEIVPGLTDQVVAGKHCASDGAANPMLVTPAFARAAQRQGAVIRYGTTALELLMQGSTISGVNTDAGEIEAEFVVNAAGPWAQKFNAMAACSTPIRPGRSQLLITEKMPPRLSPFLTVVEKTYLLQAPAGNVIIGIGGLPNEALEQHVDFSSVRKQVANTLKVFPWLRDVNLIRTFAGITEYTPDGEPYIGSIPDVTNFFCAVGFHGQGFCVGPMAGKILAELIEGGESPVSLAPFQPDRFSNNKAGRVEPADVKYPGSVMGPERN